MSDTDDGPNDAHGQPQAEQQQNTNGPNAEADNLGQALEQEGVDVGDDGGMMDLLGGGGVKALLLRETFQNPETGHSYSQAHLVADVINVMRMDVKQMCAIHGISVEVDKMSPEKAAELLEAVAQNDGVGIIDVFQKIEEKRDTVFEQEMDEESYEQYISFKEEMLYSVAGGGA